MCPALIIILLSILKSPDFDITEPINTAKKIEITKIDDLPLTFQEKLNYAYGI